MLNVFALRWAVYNVAALVALDIALGSEEDLHVHWRVNDRVSSNIKPTNDQPRWLVAVQTMVHHKHYRYISLMLI